MGQTDESSHAADRSASDEAPIRWDPNDPVIYVGRKFANGLSRENISGPGGVELTHDWTKRSGSRENAAKIDSFERWSLAKWRDHVFNRRDTPINHIVQFTVFGADGNPLPSIPRICKGEIDLLPKGYRARRTCLYMEFDLPGHTSWKQLACDDPEKTEAIRKDLEEALSHRFFAKAIVRLSRRGFHVCFVLKTPLDLEESERYEAQLKKILAAEVGLQFDDQSKGWPHLMRHPCAPYDPEIYEKKKRNGKRVLLSPEARAVEQAKADKKFEESLEVATLLRAEWSPIDPAEFAPPPLSPPVVKPERARGTKKQQAVSRRRAERGGETFVPAPEIHARWNRIAKPIGEAIRKKSVQEQSVHRAYVQLSRYLCGRLPETPNVIPTLVYLIATHAESKDPDKRMRDAETTVRKWLNGNQGLMGAKHLREEYPDIYAAAEHAFASSPIDTAGNEYVMPELLAYEDAQREVERAIEGADRGVELLKVSPGAGKSFLVAKHAAWEFSAVGAWTFQFPKEAKVGIATNTNRLAKTISREVQRTGARHLRVYGPSSVTGEGACKFREAADALAGAGQSVFATLCTGGGKRECEHFKGCKAKDGAEGDPGSKVMIGPHAKLPEILAHVGVNGQLMVDEELAAIDHCEISLPDLEHTRSHAEHFLRPYRERMAPLLESMTAWVSTIGAIGSAIDFAEIPDRCVDAVDPDTLELACRSAHIEQRDSVSKTVRLLALSAIDDGKPPNPPIRPGYGIDRLKKQPSFARAFARASRVFNELYNAAQSNRARVHVSEKNGVRVATFVNISPTFKGVVTRSGSTLLLDATGETQVDVLRALNPAARVKEIHLADRCKVTREMYEMKTFKSDWFADDKDIVWEDRTLVLAFEKVRNTIETRRRDVAEPGEAPRGTNICIITHRTLRLVIQAAMNVQSPDVLDPRAEWRKLGLSDESLEHGISVVRSYLPADARYTLFHYGNERGYDEGNACDTIITLGDPRPNGDAMAFEAELLDVDAFERGRVRAAAILTQAVGRARHVSPHRTGGSLYALHIGEIPPSEPQWNGPDVVRTFAPNGRPVVNPELPRDAVGVWVKWFGTQAETARVMAVSKGTMSLAANGKRDRDRHQLSPVAIAKLIVAKIAADRERGECACRRDECEPVACDCTVVLGGEPSATVAKAVEEIRAEIERRSGKPA